MPNKAQNPIKSENLSGLGFLKKPGFSEPRLILSKRAVTLCGWKETADRMTAWRNILHKFSMTSVCDLCMTSVWPLSRSLILVILVWFDTLCSSRNAFAAKWTQMMSNHLASSRHQKLTFTIGICVPNQLLYARFELQTLDRRNDGPMGQNAIYNATSCWKGCIIFNESMITVLVRAAASLSRTPPRLREVYTLVGNLLEVQS